MEELPLAENALLDSSVRIKATSVLYKKSVKPLIEKKRRARINASLDQLKGLLQDDEGPQSHKVSKLEKADVLELAVKHLQRLKRSGAGITDSIMDFSAGYSHCQSTVSSYLSSVNTLNPNMQSQLLQHIDPAVRKPLSVHGDSKMGNSGQLQLAAPQIWQPQEVMASPHHIKIHETFVNVDCGLLSPEQCIPVPQLCSQPLCTFQMTPVLERFSAISPGLAKASDNNTHHFLPSLLTTQSLPTPGNTKRQYPPSVGLLNASYHAQPTSTASDFSCSLGYSLESLVPQSHQNPSHFQADTLLECPQAQVAAVGHPQIWRPW
ncbi:protein hairy-like [Pleurodeles waltl]|uniref:protein hairy-like n=1 Tax=Pleurodeles waltl TaxID=8319 RepID=UPI0037093890